MMMKKLPVGVENFEELRTEDFYYVDKTGFIRELLNHWGKVNLFTRPRRFGKSLNMSMLKYFFEYGCNETLFEGLEIAGEQELCQKYRGNFPVISITLKGVSARHFDEAKALLRSVIGRESLRFFFLADSTKLIKEEKELYAQLINVDTRYGQGFLMSDAMLMDSLLILSRLLHKHYHKKVILLIDEYDVPLDKAEQNGYFDEMADLIRSLLGQVLKTNDSLYFAVLIGCLRIAKESIFTGLNNFNVMSITDVSCDEYFGFSDREVRKMLDDYALGTKHKEMQAWYDGYRFGHADIYCPWDVINYVNLMRTEPDAEPRAFWLNTSGNDILRRFLQKASISTRREIEKLIAGECIAKKINQELTYRDLYRNTNNLWSILFTTGYLTQRGKCAEDSYWLAIPNQEIRKIFIEQILEWIQEEARRDTPRLDAFCEAFAQGNSSEIEQQFNSYLQKTISIRDSNVQKTKKENFYHGILLGLLSHREDWGIESNAEAGEGYSDILVEMEEKRIGIIIEIKYPDNGNLEAGCQKALEQIEKKNYTERLLEDGMETILSYGIACWKKKCMVCVQKEERKENGNIKTES